MLATAWTAANSGMVSSVSRPHALGMASGGSHVSPSMPWLTAVAPGGIAKVQLCGFAVAHALVDDAS